jgi:hypothetical protein
MKRRSDSPHTPVETAPLQNGHTISINNNHNHHTVIHHALSLALEQMHNVADCL